MATSCWRISAIRGIPIFAIAANYTSYGNFLSFAPNSGGGHFGALSVTNPTNAVGILGVGDFNHDGKLDFVAAGVGIGNDPTNDQGFQVFLGNGDGTFQAGYIQTFGGKPVGFPLSPAAVYVGDFNRDGKGTYNYGTVFKITRAGMHTTLHSFAGTVA